MDLQNHQTSQKLAERFEFRSILPEETDQAVTIEHICFPADAVRASFELVTIRNTSDAARTLSSSARTGEAAHTLGPMGIDIIWTESDFTETTLAPGESYTYYIAFRGGIANEPVAAVDPAEELARRRCRAAALKTPDQQ